MSDNQDRRRRSPSPVAKQIIWIGGVSLLLTLGIIFLIVRPHYVKIQDEITDQKDRIQRDLQTLKSKNTKTINTLEKEKKELQVTVADLQAKQQKYSRRIQKLNQELEKLNAQIQSLENEQTDLKTTQLNLEAEKSNLKMTLSKLEEEKSALDDELRQLRLSSGQMSMEEKTGPGMFESKKMNRISGTQIILHYAKEEEDRANQIMAKLTDLGGRVQLNAHKASEVSKHKNTIYYYKGNETVQVAEQIKESLADTEPLQVVESKVWWFWIDMDKINLWL